MERAEIEQKVNDIIIDLLGINASDMKPEAKLGEDFNADSLDSVEITMALEDEFDVQIPEEKIFGLDDCTVGAIYDIIEEMTTTNCAN